MKKEKVLFGLGNPNDAYKDKFIGNSYVNPLNYRGVPVYNVTFEAGCRNNWHIHHKSGQILLCTDGEGVYQEWGCAPRRLLPGDVVYIDPELKHFHGATDKGVFAHIALEIPSADGYTEWLEPVDDDTYLNTIQILKQARGR